MTVSKSFTFYARNVNELTWAVADSSGGVVNDATVTATLYWRRDRLKPAQTPGTPVPYFNSVTLDFNSTTNIYEVSTSAEFDPPIGGDYVLTVDVVNAGSVLIAHWERPAVVTETGP